MEKAAGFFEQALQKDSNYAPAYAVLANAYGSRLQGHLVRPKEGLRKMEEAIRRALEPDAMLAEAHVAMAAARFNEWDFLGAERESLRAMELSPSDALARNWYGYYLGAIGRRKDYVNEARRALALDPLNRMSNGNFATALFDAGQYAEAFEQTKRALALDSNFTTAIRLRAALHARMDLEPLRGDARFALMLGRVRLLKTGSDKRLNSVKVSNSLLEPTMPISLSAHHNYRREKSAWKVAL